MVEAAVSIAGYRMALFLRRLARTFSIREMFKVQLRADSFNSSNTAHYDNPNTTFGSSTFGQVTTAGGNYGNGHGDPRQFEFSLKAFF
jgi:hypothetical protein